MVLIATCLCVSPLRLKQGINVSIRTSEYASSAEPYCPELKDAFPRCMDASAAATLSTAAADCGTGRTTAAPCNAASMPGSVLVLREADPAAAVAPARLRRSARWPARERDAGATAWVPTRCGVSCDAFVLSAGRGCGASAASGGALKAKAGGGAAAGAPLVAPGGRSAAAAAAAADCCGGSAGAVDDTSSSSSSVRPKRRVPEHLGDIISTDTVSCLQPFVPLQQPASPHNIVFERDASHWLVAGTAKIVRWLTCGCP